MDPNVKKTALRMIPYGLYVLTAEGKDGRVAAATVNWVTQASFNPPLVVVGVKADSGAHSIITPALPFCHIALRSSKPKPPNYPCVLNTLGDHIRKRRLELGLYQREVASKIGVDESTVYRWERNETSPPSRFIPQIINFLGYNPLCKLGLPE